MRARNGHVVVVGAGPGGLASALLLAAAGLRVTVLERSDRVGGRTSALTGDGFRFDVGPTFFLYPRVLSEIYAAAGYDLRREIEMVRLDPQYRLVFGEGGVLDATADLDAMERRVAALAPADAPNLHRFLADNRAKLEAFRPILENPFNGPRDLFRKELLPALPWLAPWRSLDRELGRYFADPRLRLAFSFQSKYLGMSPFRCPSLFSILSFLEYEHGVFHPIGGCAAVMEATARIAGGMGVEIRLGDPVTGFDFQDRRPVAAHTAAGERIAADAFVVNADFAHAMGRLVPDRLRRRWSDRALAEKKYSCSTFMLYLGIDGVERELPHHTIYVARDYRRNLDDVERAHRLSDDPSFYVQNACVTDPTLAPRGASTLYVLVPVPHQNARVDWRRERGPFRERVLAQLARVGLEDVERRIRFERVTTPDDWAERHAVYRGATFNLAHSLDQMLHRRPHNRFEELDGVYLVGGGTHPGSGLPVIFESARISSRLLLEELGVPVPWSAPNRAAAGGGRAEPPELAEAV